jgi:hypothetical protein
MSTDNKYAFVESSTIFHSVDLTNIESPVKKDFEDLPLQMTSVVKTVSRSPYLLLDDKGEKKD